MKHIVALSGGKDSTAMALALKEYDPADYQYICTPTGDELPEMEDHWKRLEDILKAPIIRIQNETIFDLIRRMKMLPNFRARFCTRILKIEAAQEYYEQNKPAIIYVGLRADEAKRQGNKLYDKHITQKHPMKEWDWDLNCVRLYLRQNKIEIPYRTDCGMCFYQRLIEWWLLWKKHPERLQKYIEIML
jgi:3'-phosphoadenosine 5'-phosphosulfate sulfotransferase (PAPS reductase)/FAD synthetase